MAHTAVQNLQNYKRQQGSPPSYGCMPHLENVGLQDVVAKLHGLLAVQLALLSREHERQESVSAPRMRNRRAHDERSCATPPRTLPCNPRTLPQCHHIHWVGCCLLKMANAAYSMSHVKGFFWLPRLCGVTLSEALVQGKAGITHSPHQLSLRH